MGYSLAGFDVIGVDVKPQPDYPFDFILSDALKIVNFTHYDAIHASPPCQAHSTLKHRHKDRNFIDLVAATRKQLKVTTLPYVIENVVGAPLHRPIGLCGSMFNLGAGGRYLRRHRLFECNFPIEAPGPCRHVGQAIGVYGHGGGGEPATSPRAAVHPDKVRSGGYKGTWAECCEAMQIDWMKRPELSQAIPPAYTWYIGKVLIQWLNSLKAQ